MRRGKWRGFRFNDVFGALSLLCLILFFVFATEGGASELAISMIIACLVFIFAWAIAAKNA